MHALRIISSTSAAAATALALTPATPVRSAAEPVPAATIKATVAPRSLPLAPGTPLTLRLDTRFASDPLGAGFVLQHADYLFGKGARFNAKLFPTCSAARLRAARGLLRVCPKGSKIGSGTAWGTAVALGIESSGKVTLFNGPGGRSVTMNVDVERPAIVNETFSAPISRLHGRYTFKLSAPVPRNLQTIIGGDIVVTRIDVTAGATRVVDGVKRGYFEVKKCPPHGSAIHGEFSFRGGARAIADETVVC